jgi:hypothetical protein
VKLVVKRIIRRTQQTSVASACPASKSKRNNRKHFLRCRAVGLWWINYFEKAHCISRLCII